MTSTAKLLTTAITGIGVVGGGVGAFYAKDYFLKEGPSKAQEDSGPKKISFRQRLQDNGKKLLDKQESDDRWEYKLKTYQTEKEKLDIKLDVENIATLKSVCESNLDSKSEEENTKLIADLEKICTAPTNKERLIKEGKQLIQSEEDWAEKAGLYKSKSSGADAIPEIPLGKEDKEAMKKWCNEKLEKEYQDHGDYGIFLQWCTKEG